MKVCKYSFLSTKINLLSSNLKGNLDVDFIFIDIDKCLVPFKVDDITSSTDNSIIYKEGLSSEDLQITKTECRLKVIKESLEYRFKLFNQ